MKDKDWEIGAVYDAIFGARGEFIQGSTLFCSYFPSLEETILAVSVGIISINFTGGIDDPETVRFLNALSESGVPLEIVELEKK